MAGEVIPMRRNLGAAEQDPPAAGAPTPQPPVRAQLAGDIAATAAQLRSATAQLVAVAAPADQAPLLATYQSLMGDLQTLSDRLQAAVDGDLADIGTDFQGTLRAATDYLTEAGKVIGAARAAAGHLAPARFSGPWRWVALVAGVAVVVGGGYWLLERRKKKSRGGLRGFKRRERDDED